VLLGFAGLPRIALTAAAREMARRLGRPLLRADLSASTGHYIGETEKNLLAVFSRAESSDAVLLFDEADALFGKRTQVDSSHDRFANMETNHLLARLPWAGGAAVRLAAGSATSLRPATAGGAALSAGLRTVPLQTVAGRPATSISTMCHQRFQNSGLR
jgi:SpoVK/Ycf46/Vps4 family AAA+-type ATPase